MVTEEFNQQVEKHYRHNFLFNMLDGALFWLGFNFFAPSQILPLYASYFTQNTFLIGLIASIGSIGYLIPQLFTANRVQRMPRKKTLVVKAGFFLERVPIILLPLSAFLFAGSNPVVALVLLYLLFTWHSLGAGMIAVAWQDMVAKVIPVNRRGRFFGITNFLGTGTGVVGAAGAAWMLASYPFPMGYVLCFAVAALFIFLSWVAIAQTREPALLTQEQPRSQIDFFRQLPAIIRRDVNFARYLATAALITLSNMGVGFLMVYVVRRWELNDSLAGVFTSVMLIGQSLANLIYGALADRKGHKVVMEISVLAGTAAFGLAAFAPDWSWFYVVFILRGAYLAGALLSGIAIALEFSSPEMRPTYIGINSTFSGVAAVLAPLVGSLLADLLGFQALFLIGSLVGLVSLGMLRWLVREPREHQAAGVCSPF